MLIRMNGSSSSSSSNNRTPVGGGGSPGSSTGGGAALFSSALPTGACSASTLTIKRIQRPLYTPPHFGFSSAPPAPRPPLLSRLPPPAPPSLFAWPLHESRKKGASKTSGATLVDWLTFDCADSSGDSGASGGGSGGGSGDGGSGDCSSGESAGSSSSSSSSPSTPSSAQSRNTGTFPPGFYGAPALHLVLAIKDRTARALVAGIRDTHRPASEADRRLFPMMENEQDDGTGGGGAGGGGAGGGYGGGGGEGGGGGRGGRSDGGGDGEGEHGSRDRVCYGAAGTIVGGLVSGDEQRILAGLPGSLVDAKGVVLTIAGATRVTMVDETSCGDAFLPAVEAKLKIAGVESDNEYSLLYQDTAVDHGLEQVQILHGKNAAVRARGVRRKAERERKQRQMLLNPRWLTPQLGFTVSCMARGPSYHTTRDVEAEAHQALLGPTLQNRAGVPLIGFFANGEIGTDLAEMMRDPIAPGIVVADRGAASTSSSSSSSDALPLDSDGLPTYNELLAEQPPGPPTPDAPAVVGYCSCLALVGSDQTAGESTSMRRREGEEFITRHSLY